MSPKDHEKIRAKALAARRKNAGAKRKDGEK
jgi:hypothetical protein